MSALGSLRTVRVPRGGWGVRPVLAAHVAAQAWNERNRPHPLRKALAHLGFMEASLRSFGRGGMLSTTQAFYPLFLLPNFHGPHFDEALRRLLLDGRGPFVVHLAVTGACPCHCAYCYAAAGGAQLPDLGDERLMDVGRAIARSGVPLFVLSGGEPMLRLDRTLALVRLLSSSSEVRLATSGIGMTEDRARTLRDAGLSVLAVSLDTDDPRAFNRVRGHPEAHRAAVRALRCATEADLAAFATAVVGRSAFQTEVEVDRFLAFVRAVDPSILVNFLPKFATGRALSDDGFRTPQEYAGVARRIARVIRRGRYQASVFLQPVEWLMGCVGGARRQMNIDVRGNVAACISGATFGNVLEEDFETLSLRFSRPGGRFKRGFFCASMGEQAAGTALDAKQSAQALEAFYASHRDTAFQRLLDLAGDRLAWWLGSV